MKNFKKSLLTLTNDLNSSTEKKICWPQLRKKNLLKNRLSIRVRIFAPLNAPLNMFKIFFNPEVAHTWRLYCVKIRKIRAIEYLSLGTFKRVDQKQQLDQLSYKTDFLVVDLQVWQCSSVQYVNQRRAMCIQQESSHQFRSA